MYYLLYNPMSNAGKTAKSILKLEKELHKKGHSTFKINLLELKEINKVKESIKEEDILVIAGGDGTLHRLVNHHLFNELNNRVFMYRSGRGNDFCRGHKGKFFEITKEIKSLPQIIYADKKSYFINGVGMGIDALTCKVQMDNFYSGKKESYFKIAFNAFKTFKPFDLNIIVDGKEYNFNKVWFFVIQNGKYFGGGMKISPLSLREDDELELCIVHSVGFRRLLCIFPLIFIGKHTIAHKYVTFIKGKHFIATPQGWHIMQQDGEVETDIKSIEVKR